MGYKPPHDTARMLLNPLDRKVREIGGIPRLPGAFPLALDAGRRGHAGPGDGGPERVANRARPCAQDRRAQTVTVVPSKRVKVKPGKSSL